MGQTESAEEREKRSAAAEKIAVEASRLARMATANNLPMIAYLIEMAVIEAWREASEPASGGRGDGANPPSEE
jgi:hypothetical protein